MPQYIRKSIRNSLTNTEKAFVENVKNAVIEKEANKISGKFLKWAKIWDKLVYTFCILFIYLTYGLCFNIFPPAMVDMGYLYRTSLDKINYGNTFQSAGYLIGSLAGFLYKYINRQLSFIVNVVILGVFTAAQPTWSSFYLFYMSMFLGGFGAAVWDSGNSVWVVEMWKENSPPVLCLSQTMYGVGSIIAPLLAKPYICGDLSINNKTDDLPSFCIVNTTTVPTILNPNVTHLNDTNDEYINYLVDRRSHLKIPYFITGVLTLAVPIGVLLVMFFIKRYQIPADRTQPQKIEPNLVIEDLTNKTIQVSPRTRNILIALVALSLNSYTGLENTFFYYSATYYQYLPIGLSAPQAAQLMSVMTATYTGGRGVSALISAKLRAETMLTYHLITLLISYAILYFGQHSMALIYTGNAILGFGFSAMWPSYFAFAEKHIRLTDKVTSIFSFVSSIVGLGLPFILGPLIEKHPEVFMYLEIGLFSTVAILFIIIMIIIKRSQRYPISYNVNNHLDPM